MNFKLLILAAISPVVLMSQVSQAANTTVKKTWVYDFKYSDSNCKKNGYGGGMATFNGTKVCTKRDSFTLSNQKAKSSTKWNKRTSASSWHRCSSKSQSCSTTLSEGKNDCVSTGSTTSNSVTVSANLSYGIGVKLLSGGGSIAYGRGWTKTKGTNKCVTSNLSLSCSVGPGKQVRLSHSVKMQRFQSDTRIQGWKLRRQKTVTKYNRRVGGARPDKVTYSKYDDYSSQKKTFKNAVFANLPVDRFSTCETKNL